MKLRELDAQFLKITDERHYQTKDVSLDEAQGIIFLCPKCFEANSGDVGTHSVICWFRNRNVPDDLSPKPGRWTPEGTGIDDLTFVPGEPPDCSERALDERMRLAWIRQERGRFLMSALITTIADAVVTTINAAVTANTLVPPSSFTATRAYVPVYDLQKDLPNLKVTIVAHSLALKRITRNMDDISYEIDIGFQQALPKSVLTEADRIAFCDPLMLLIEDVILLFQGKPLVQVPGVQCMDSANPLIYDPQLMDELRLFSSIATITFKAARTR